MASPRSAGGLLHGFTAVVVIAVGVGPASAQTSFWNVSGGGSWTDPLNWSSGVPNSATQDAGFWLTTPNGVKTVTLDAAITTRSLTIASPQTAGVTINAGTGPGTLSLVADGSPAGTLVSSTTGPAVTHTINADVALSRNGSGDATHNWNIGPNVTFAVGGNVSQAGGNQSVTKLGTGTLLLNATNSFVGATTVTAGTLGGSGSVSSPVTVGTAGTITAGTGVGVGTTDFGTGNLTVEGAGTYLVNLFGTGATDISLLAVSGAVDLTSTSDAIRLGLSGTTVDALRGVVGAGNTRAYAVLTNSGTRSGTFNTTDFTSAGFDASEWSITYNANDITLSFTPIPEPAPVLGLAAAGLAAAGLARRRRAHGAVAQAA